MAMTKIARVIKAAEDKINADAATIKAELDSVTATLPVLQEKVQDLKDDLGAEAEVKSRIKKGEPVEAMDLLLARAEDEIVEYRLKVNENRARILSERLPAPSPWLADKIVPAFETLLPGVDVITTTAPLSLWKSEISEGTLAVVIHQGPKIETNPFSQLSTGNVTAYFIRTGMMRPVSVADFEKVALAKRLMAQVTANEVADENGWVSVTGPDNGNQSDPRSLVMDELTIRVSGILGGLPVYPSIHLNSPVKDMVLRVFSGYTQDGIVTTARVSVDPDPGEGTSFKIGYGPSVAIATHETTEETVNDGERALTLRQVVNVTSVEPSEFAEELTKAANNMVGSVHSGMGVLSDANVSYRLGRMQGTYSIEVELTYLSRTAGP